MCGEQSCLGAAAGWEPPAARGSTLLGREVLYRPREGPPGTTARLGRERRRLGADRARHHALIEINSLTHDGPRGEGPSAAISRPQPLKFLFMPPCQAHGVTQSSRSGIVSGHSPLLASMAFGFFPVSSG